MDSPDIHQRLADVLGNVRAVARSFGTERQLRQARTTLDRADFDRLRDAGLLRTGLPAERGGLWVDPATSARGISELYRALAAGDSSVALVSAMHPVVLAYWLATPTVTEQHQQAWDEQRARLWESVEQGAWWGTITSEPGSGGDVLRTSTMARHVPGGARLTATADWLLSGEKHFGSGSGITSYVVTTARAEGEDEPDWFFLPMDGQTFDGANGITMAAPWDGHGMQATQSHAFAFQDAPAERVAWPGHLTDLMGGAGGYAAIVFTAVVLGILETAVAEARKQLSARSNLRPYEQVEWAQAELEAWTVEQAYEGALRVIESGAPSRGAALRAKTISAQLAESSLQRICRVLGGGTFGRRSPFGHWFEDVRALGFLRPPWALAFDGLIADSLNVPE